MNMAVNKQVVAMFKPTMTGWFKLAAVKLDGSRRELTPWFPNIVLDNGLDQVGSQNYTGYCQVGTGNSTPVITQTNLDAFVAGVARTTTPISGVFGNPSSLPLYAYTTYKYSFAVGAATGNLSEVGIGPTSSGPLFARSLIVDGLGNPTTITVLSDESLEVTYQLRLYPPLVDTSFNVTINSVNYACVCRAWNVSNAWVAGQSANSGAFNAGAYDGAMNTDIMSPFIGGSGLGGLNTSNLIPYVPGSKQIDCTMVWGTSSGNGNIMTIAIGTQIGGFQIGFTPTLPKLNTQNLTLVARLTWDRHAP